MEDHGLGDVLSDRLGVLEDGSPLGKSLNLRAHTFTGTEHGRERTSDRLGELGGLDQVLGLDVSDKLLNLGDERLGISSAGLDLSKVVLTDETTDHAGKELNRALNRGEGVGGLVLSRSDGTNSEGKGGSGVLAGAEVVSSRPVALLLGDVFTDSRAVEEPVLADGSSESGGMGEDLGPGLNLSDVGAHALAGGQGGADLSPDGTGILDSREVFAMLEITHGFLGVSDDLFTALVAELNLGEVVVTSHTEHKSSDEFGDRLDIEGGGRGGEARSSESFHFAKVLFIINSICDFNHNIFFLFTIIGIFLD